jgi:DNA-binding winged helix-turn-helix (wHTH) protein
MFRSISDYTGVNSLEGKSVQASVTYEFGPFTLDPSKRLLHRAGVTIALSPKGFDALIVLIEHRDLS